MGRQVQVAGREIEVVWQGRRVRAFVPELLAGRDLDLTPTTLRKVARAEAEVAVAAARMPEQYAPLARLLLRAEGTASSYLEGITADLADVVLAGAASGAEQSPAGWIAANLAAVTDAVAAADTPLTAELLCTWHATLLAGSPLGPRHVGQIRSEQGWIGGASPLDAALVTPPPDRLDALLEDLVTYANRDDVDPVAQAAVVHAQFEVIHPFGDGNGRIGRVLISWLLARRMALVTPPPVSLRLAADRDGYLSGLTLFRLGGHDRWIGWFADAVSGAGAAQEALVREVEALHRVWHSQLSRSRQGPGVRRDALAWRVLDLLPSHLALSSALVSSRLDASARAATGALAELDSAGILTRHARPGPTGRPGRRAFVYVCPSLLEATGSVRSAAGGKR